MSDERYEIIGTDLPVEMRGLWTYAEAYAKACAWNACRPASRMCWPQKIERDHFANVRMPSYD